MPRLRFASFVSLVALTTALHSSAFGQPKDDVPDWTEPMREVHARFEGESGSIALFGDSITDTLAFWTPLEYDSKGMSDSLRADLETAKAHLKSGSWRDNRGPKFGNQSGQTVGWAEKNVADWLERLDPEVAIILFGTNDLKSLDSETYRERLDAVVEKTLANGTIPILTTVPPRHGMVEKTAAFAEAAREIAEAKQIPLVDYHAEILKRRPDDWDGTDERFAGEGSPYDVPTLIARDGVHPSNPKEWLGFSEETLRRNGYALRNALTLAAYADVTRAVLASAEDAAE